MTLTLHHQITGRSEDFCDRLNTLLKSAGLKSVRFSVAYARWDGIGLISAALEAFLERGGKFETVYGAGNGVTTADALHYGLYLASLYPKKTYCGFIEDEYANAIFHPKFYEFRFKDRVIALVGSPNLTGGGLARNGEMAVELSVPLGDPLDKKLSAFWKWAMKEATAVTPAEVRRLAAAPGAGRERADEVGGAKSNKPFMTVKAHRAPKPVFEKVLNLPPKKKEQKNKLLEQMDSITEKPKQLYLQIFARETGGHGGKPGAMVQLPVATLGAYFAMVDNEDREITFRLPGETIKSRVIHNSNHTHQVRLSPIFSVARPAIIRFERLGSDLYKARFIPSSAYAGTLASKCPEQRRKGARRWGIFA